MGFTTSTLLNVEVLFAYSAKMAAQSVEFGLAFLTESDEFGLCFQLLKIEGITKCQRKLFTLV